MHNFISLFVLATLAFSPLSHGLAMGTTVNHATIRATPVTPAVQAAAAVEAAQTVAAAPAPAPAPVSSVAAALTAANIAQSSVPMMNQGESSIPLATSPDALMAAQMQSASVANVASTTLYYAGELNGAGVPITADAAAEANENYSASSALLAAQSQAMGSAAADEYGGDTWSEGGYGAGATSMGDGSDTDGMSGEDADDGFTNPDGSLQDVAVTASYSDSYGTNADGSLQDVDVAQAMSALAPVPVAAVAQSVATPPETQTLDPQAYQDFAQYSPDLMCQYGTDCQSVAGSIGSVEGLAATDGFDTIGSDDNDATDMSAADIASATIATDFSGLAGTTSASSLTDGTALTAATATTTTDPTTTASASTTDTSAPPAPPVAQTGSVGGNSASTNYGGGLNFATGDSSNTPIVDNTPLQPVQVTASLIGSSSSGNNSNDTSLDSSVASATLAASANMAAGTGNVATYVPGGTIADANASFAADPPTDPSLGDTLFRPAAPPVDPALGETIPRGLNTGLNDGIEPNWWINNTPSQADMLETIQNLPQFTWCATGQMCGSIATQVDNILKGGDGGVLLPQDGAYFSSTYSNMGLTVPTSNLTADQALAAMAASPDGSTFFVNMTPVGGGTGHVINGVNFAQESGTGITMFVDGQWGGQYASPNLGQFTQNNPDNYTYSIVDTSNARIDNPNLLAAENVSLYSNTANAYSAGGEQILNDFLGLAKPLAGTIADTSMALASGALDLAGGPVGVGLLANAALDPLYQNVGSLAQSGMSKNLQTLVSPNSSFGGNVDAASALLLDTTVAGLTAAGHEVNALPGQALSALDSAMSPQGLISQNVASMQAQLNQQYGAPTASFNAAVQMANANGYVIGPDGQTWITPASAAQQYPNQPIQEVTVTAQAPSMGTAVVANLQNIGSNIGGGLSNAYTGAVGTVASLFCKMSSNCQ